MLCCFQFGHKKEEETTSEEEEETLSSCFLYNGSVLLEELITTFNGRQEIPIRSYTAEQLITATNYFSDKVLNTDSRKMYKGSINERLVLVMKFRDEEMNPKRRIHDIAITSQMSQLKNVLKLSGCCLEFKYPALIYEYVEFETMDDLLQHNDKLLPWRNRIKIALDISSTVLFLHTSFQTPIIYRNLSPSNVIIDEHGVAKLIDFSLSISLPPGESQVKDDVFGSYGFIDPEYSNSGILTQKSDVYSFGVMLLVLVTGQKHIFINNSDYKLINVEDYVKHHFEKDELSQMIDPKIANQGFDQKQLQAILNLCMRCTQEKGEDRPEMIEVARELLQIEKSVNRYGRASEVSRHTHRSYSTSSSFAYDPSFSL